MPGGFMGDMGQQNERNRGLLKKNRQDQKQFLSGIDNIDGIDRKSNEPSLTVEQQYILKKEIEAKKQSEKNLRIIIFFGALVAGTALAFLLAYAVS
jgi:hypothetical protein